MNDCVNEYYRPVVQHGAHRPEDAVTLAGGWCWFTHVERLTRDGERVFLPADALPARVRQNLTAPRPPVAGLDLSSPRLMGILNVTPDSFSDGGQHNGPARALARAQSMIQGGADIVDIGGESTRPGAHVVPVEAEIARVEPVIAALSKSSNVPISIDTRKRAVAEVAVNAGATMVNDVSGFVHDKCLARYCAQHHLPVCVMHMQGTPETMQDDPRYDDVLLDVYDFLAAQICMLEELGIPRYRIVADPGIGFGKTIDHNLALLNGLSLFHGLGVALLLGASRKGLIRVVGQAPQPEDRMPGSVAVALAGVAQGVQVLRVHDVAETKQALRLWQAIDEGKFYGT